MGLPVLRPYQDDLVGRVYQSWSAGARNVVMRLDTGGGKTVCLSTIILRHQGASCVIAHRDLLVSQLSVALARNGVKHNIIASKETVGAIVREHIDKLGRSFYDPGARCMVASVDTLIRRTNLAHIFAQVTLWIVDEAHHLVNDNKWHKAISLFTHPQCIGLMPTATPVRADGKGLGRHAHGVADVMVEGPPMKWLIEQGYLSPYKLICPLSDMQVVAEVGASGDWSTKQLREAAEKSHIVGDIVDTYLRFAAGKLGVTFATDVETANKITVAYRAAGVRAETLTGETDGAWRVRMLKMFEARQIDQIVAVDIISEGFDLPAIEVASFGRPTQSLSLYMQQFGRALRPMPGKDYALIIDHVGNVLRHQGTPDKPRPWTLDARNSRGPSGATGTPIRICTGEKLPDGAFTGCLQTYEGWRSRCPYCGEAPPVQARGAPKQVDGVMGLMDDATLAFLRGELERMDAHPSTVGLQYAAKGMPNGGAAANMKRHAKKQEAQARLREAMAWWGGKQRAAGLDDDEIQRLFYFTFGMDVLTAQTLDVLDAETLEARVRDNERNGQDCTA